MAKIMCKTHIKLQNAKQKISFFGVRQFNMQFTHVFFALGFQKHILSICLEKVHKAISFWKA